MTMEYCKETQDESSLERTTEQPSKANIRRTRLKMFVDEFQNEIAMLEEKVEKYAAENLKLKSENEYLRQQLDDSKMISMKLASESIDGGKVTSDMSTAGDISTIIKLSNKLQEMINVNESITHVNVALRKDVKNLTNERDMHLQDITKLREEKTFSHTRDTYSKYATLKAKVDNYEREIQHWKNAMKRADNRIEDLGRELEKYKRSSNNMMAEKQIKDFSYNATGNNLLNNCSPLQHLQENQNKCVTNVSNATEALQKLLSNIDSTKNDFPFAEGKLDDDGYPETMKSANPIMELSNSNQPHSQSNSPKQDDIKTTDLTAGKDSNELFSDPIRFPACVKLLELTKARQNDDSTINTLLNVRNNPLNEPGKHFPTSLPDNRSIHNSSTHSNSNQGNSNQGNNNHGNSNNGSSNHGNSNYGNSNHGSSNHGSSNHGSSNHGNSNHGKSNHGDSNQQMMFWNNGIAFSNSNSAGGGEVVHHHAESSVEERSNKGDVDDDITIVLPSSDHALIQQQTPDNNQAREILFPSPNNRNVDSTYRRRMEQEVNPSDSHFPADINNMNAMGMPPQTDYPYYPPNAYPVTHHPPVKKIKVEDVFK